MIEPINLCCSCDQPLEPYAWFCNECDAELMANETNEYDELGLSDADSGL